MLLKLQWDNIATRLTVLEPAGLAAVAEVPNGAVDDRGRLVELLRGRPIVGGGGLVVSVGPAEAAAEAGLGGDGHGVTRLLLMVEEDSGHRVVRLVEGIAHLKWRRSLIE